MANLKHKRKIDLKKVIPTEVYDKFVFKNDGTIMSSRFFSQKYGEVNLHKLTIAKANQLLKLGWPCIKKLAKN